MANRWDIGHFNDTGATLYRGYIIEIDELLDCEQDAKVEVAIPFVTEFYSSSTKNSLNDSVWVQVPFSDGSYYAKGYVVNGLPQGVWQFFGKTGELVKFGRYDKGKKEGVWLEGDLTGVHIDQSVCFDPSLMESLIQNMSNINLERFY